MPSLLKLFNENDNFLQITDEMKKNNHSNKGKDIWREDKY